MAIGNVFALGTVVTSAGQINQIESSAVNPGVETMIYGSTGQVERRFGAVMFQAPVLSFATSAIARALGFAGLNGLALAGTASDFYFQKVAQGSTRTNTACVKMSASYGLLCPRTISAADRQHAVLNYELAARSNDGTTAPLAVAVDQTMPAVTADDQLFTVGPAAINGTAIADVQSITIDLGLQLVITSGGGESYPTFVAIARRAPSIVIATHDMVLADTLGQHVAQSTTDSIVYLRKIAKNGTRVANGTAEHISFSVDDGIISVRNAQAADGQSPEPGLMEVVIEPTWDGTADTLAMNLATTIA